jgi:hypothetical protein
MASSSRWSVSIDFQEFFLAADECTATDKVVAAELLQLLDFHAEVFGFALGVFHFAGCPGLGFGDDDFCFFFGSRFDFVYRFLHGDDCVLDGLSICL